MLTAGEEVAQKHLRNQIRTSMLAGPAGVSAGLEPQTVYLNAFCTDINILEY